MSEFAEMTLHPAYITAWAIVGVIAGWLARQIMSSDGYGVGDMIAGMIGAVIGGFVAKDFGFWSGIAIAFGGACVFIIVSRFMFRGHTQT